MEIPTPSIADLAELTGSPHLDGDLLLFDKLTDFPLPVGAGRTVLEHGEIIERGDHDDLLSQKGRYYRLYTGSAELSYGKVVRILPIGAFVELAPGKDGMIHISKLENRRVEKVEDVLNIGDMTWVKVTEIDEKGRVNLSRKDALKELAAAADKK